MILDKNNQLHDRAGRYSHKVNAPSNVVLRVQVEDDDEEMFETPVQKVERKADRVFRSRVERTRQFMVQHGKKPSYSRETDEEKELYNFLSRVRTMDKYQTLTADQRAMIEDLPLSVLGGVEGRSATIGAIKRSLSQKQVDPEVFMSEHFPHQFATMRAHINNVRRGTPLYEYPEYDKAITKIMGDGWGNRRKPTSQKRSRSVRERETETINSLREFLKESDGRLPSRHKEGEESLAYRFRTLKTKVNGGSGVSPEAMAELDEILGVGWHQLKNRTQKTTKL